jgi:hypothetical protein
MEAVTEELSTERSPILLCDDANTQVVVRESPKVG